MMRQIPSPVYAYGYSLLHPGTSVYQHPAVSRPRPVPVHPGRLFRPVFPPPGFHTRPLYPNNGGLRDTEADQLLTCLLQALYGFEQPMYNVPKEYDYQAYERSVEELMDFDAVMTNRLSGIRTEPRLVEERVPYDHEAYERSVMELMDFDAVMTNKLKGIRTERWLDGERVPYDHEAYERSVAELMDFDAEMMNKLKEIRTERMPETKEEDAATMNNNLQKMISTVALAKPAEKRIPEKKDEELCDEYAREMDVIVEKVMKKESSKRCLRRSSRRQRIDRSSVVY